MSQIKKILSIIGVIIGIALVMLFFFYIFYLNHVDVNEFGIAYDRISGKVWLQKEPGWYVTSWMTKVTTVSTLPIKVTIPSNANVIVAKMVRFKMEGAEEYVRLQGFSYSMGSSLENTLLGYAFSGEHYSFLEIIQEVGPENLTVRPLKGVQ